MVKKNVLLFQEFLLLGNFSWKCLFQTDIKLPENTQYVPHLCWLRIQSTSCLD